MPFTVKDWKDRPFGPNTGESVADYEARLATYAAANPTLVTRIDAAALEDAETRLSGYTDTQVATRAASSHTHPAGDIASGTVATARLGSGTASATTYLRGDQTWATVAGGSSTNLSDLREIAARPGVAETFSRIGNTLAVGNIAPSGQLRLAGFMVFSAGTAVTSLACVAGTQSAVGQTNQWFCLVRASDMTVVAVTADDTTTAWNAQGTKTLTVAGGPWTPAQTETCYFGIVVVATTNVPNVYGVGMGNQTIQAIPPFVAGPSTTGLTGPVAVGTTVASLVSTNAIHNIWAWAN